MAAPAGRIVLSAWIPEGPISEMARAAREAIGRAVGAPAGPPPFAWHERDALAGVLESHGFEVTLDEEHLAFTADSPGAYLDAESTITRWRSPVEPVLEPRGEAEALRAHALEILEVGNEDPDGFRLTSRYVVATARRG